MMFNHNHIGEQNDENARGEYTDESISPRGPVEDVTRAFLASANVGIIEFLDKTSLGANSYIEQLGRAQDQLRRFITELPQSRELQELKLLYTLARVAKIGNQIPHSIPSFSEDGFVLRLDIPDGCVLKVWLNRSQELNLKLERAFLSVTEIDRMAEALIARVAGDADHCVLTKLTEIPQRIKDSMSSVRQSLLDYLGIAESMMEGDTSMPLDQATVQEKWRQISQQSKAGLDLSECSTELRGALETTMRYERQYYPLRQELWALLYGFATSATGKQIFDLINVLKAAGKFDMSGFTDMNDSNVIKLRIPGCRLGIALIENMSGHDPDTVGLIRDLGKQWTTSQEVIDTLIDPQSWRDNLGGLAGLRRAREGMINGLTDTISQLATLQSQLLPERGVDSEQTSPDTVRDDIPSVVAPGVSGPTKFHFRKES